MTILPNNPTNLVWFFLKKHKWKVTAMILLSIAIGLIPSINSILLKNIIDSVEELSDKGGATLLSSMIIWIIGYGFWWELINWTWRSYDYLFLKTMPKIKGEVLDEFYDYAQYHSHSFFQDNLTGNITNRITEASRAFEAAMSIMNEKIILKASVILAALITMYFVHPVFATIFLLWICVFCGISTFSFRVL